MAKIPSRKFPQTKKKIPSRKLASGKSKIPSRKLDSRKSTKPTASEKSQVMVRLDRPTNAAERQERLDTLKGQMKSLQSASDLPSDAAKSHQPTKTIPPSTSKDIDRQ